MPVGMVLLRGG